MTSVAEATRTRRYDDRCDARPPRAVVSERWVVATEEGGRTSYLCGGYRDEPAVTTEITTAEHFASPWAAEEARARYLERHRGCEFGLTGWRLLLAKTRTTFR